jgi:phage terminase large subunit-like protein
VGLSLLARAAREQGGAEQIVAAVAAAITADFRARGEEAPVGEELREAAARVLLSDWSVVGRPEQLAPAGDWDAWVILAGRGFGKTRAGGEWTKGEIESARCGRFALVGPTAADVRDIMIEGESGIMSLYAHRPRAERPEYEPSKRRITWPNGAIATAYSAEEPDRLRGPQHDGYWADELAAWKDPGAAWDQLQFGLRLGRKPRGVITTTPRPIPIVRRLVADPGVVVTRGSTYDNATNLAPTFLQAIRRAYEGTRLGRQEIDAEILDDNPGALWKTSRIDDLRVLVAPELARIGVGVDPAVTSDESSDETGIVVAGVAECRCKGDPELHGFVFDDVSGIYTPDGWARAVAHAYHQHQADRVVPEVNNGGDLVISNLLTLGDPDLAIVQGPNGRPGVHASRGKQTRAEPVAALYEQGKVHHVGALPKLENQMAQWNPLADRKSPDRVDALVWVLTWLMLTDTVPRFRPTSAETRAKLRRRV